MKYTFILILSIFVVGCCIDDDSISDGINCEQFADSFIDMDYEYARIVVDSICQTLPPLPTGIDELGHELNSKNIIDQINEKCNKLNIEMECYACLESLPPQSSFTLTLDSMDISIKRNLRLRVPEGDFMYMN